MSQSPARLLKPQEVAILFAVEVSTVVAWARIGKIPAIRTPGGQQYRFRPADVVAMLEPLTIIDGKASKDWSEPDEQAGASA